MAGKRNTFNYKNLKVNNRSNLRYVNIDDENVVQYLKDIRKFEQLSQEEEQSLIIRIKNNDPDSETLKNKLIGSHQPFVLMFAQRHCPCGSDMLLDLIQEGNYGMMMAFENFNIDSNVKFMTYANSWILKYMLKYLENNALVQKNNRAKTFSVDVKVRDKFIQENGYEPNCEELLLIFNEMGINIKHKEDLGELKMVSIDQPINPDAEEDDDNPNYIEIPTYDNTEEIIDNDIKSTALHKILNNKLTDIERDVITRTFGFDGFVEKDFKTIAKELGHTAYNIKAIYETAIDKLRKYKFLFE